MPLVYRKLFPKVHSLIYCKPLFALFCLLATTSSIAEPIPLLIITNNHIQIQNQVSNLLKQDLSIQEKFSIKVHHYQNLTRKQIIHSHAKLIITLGSKALELANNSSIPTLFTLIPESSLKQLNICNFKEKCHENTTYPKYSYAIYLDQPLGRQLNFLSLLLPSAKKVGVLTAPFSINKVKPLNTESAKLKLLLVHRHVKNEAMINRQLNELMENIEVLLTLPDPLIHNRNNIPYLLLSTYRYNIPVIGFSKAYVNAGAIAGIYSSPKQISQQIIELANQIMHNPDDIPQQHFSPKYFSIAFNKNVARSLDILLPDKQLIKSKLLLLEK